MATLREGSSERSKSLRAGSAFSSITCVAPLLPKHDQSRPSSCPSGPSVQQRGLNRWQDIWRIGRHTGDHLDTTDPPDGRGWAEWGQEDIDSDTLVLPLMIITFSCAYVSYYCDQEALLLTIGSLADAITLQRYSTFATSMTG